MVFERADIPFPVQAKIQARIKDRRRIERERSSSRRAITSICTGTIRPHIVARRAAVGVIVRQAQVVE
jgi:hypothetical protein